ncbi:hypothetical protein [Nocardia sp. NPDC058666]|uniref:hypothetical protein n=1 Tax=Nocardia sp. NPDC058666 TaxID=3346587 RepID=UPI00365870FF
MANTDPFVPIYHDNATDVVPVTGDLNAGYLHHLGLVAVSIDGGALFLEPTQAAILVDLLTAALNDYTFTLRAVA